MEEGVFADALTVMIIVMSFVVFFYGVGALVMWLVSSL